ncbi:MAG: N-formylglutamate amidohydrolase, partial [Deltaproteobacteria bacterium]|nr:N-formylglutamate amidohydrolase [Deltaproteobacteria bacterium]
MSFVELTHPRTTASPVLVEVPHSGLQVPPEVESEIDATPLAMLRDSDIYVDQLYQRAPD